MSLRPVAACTGELAADVSPDSPQEGTRPGKFGAEDCQAQRDDDERRPGRNEHDDPGDQDRCADDRDNDAPRQLVGHVD